MAEHEYTYKFSRMGENFDDIEKYGNEGSKDRKDGYYIKFPYLERNYDNEYTKIDMEKQDNINKNKNLDKER